jgi:uncharacterized protein
VSYLAISQYKTAALRPPALKAIVPWEGFTDAYRDLFYPGGVRERGFSRLWTTITRRTTRQSVDIGREARSRPTDDTWWRSLVPDLERITVPMLVCASFSDNNLHSRGSFRAFERVSSTDRHLYTHRGGKWTTFYGEPARSAQLAFLDRHLRGAPTPKPPVIRLEIRERGDRVAEVRDEREWPLARTRWTTLHLAEHRGAGVLTPSPPRGGSATFPARRTALTFRHVFTADTEVTGPMSARLWMSVAGGSDVSLFVGVGKERAGRAVPFEGSYGFGRDLVTTGWRRTALGVDAAEVDVELGPSATLFRAGDALVLHVSGRQLSPRDPLTGAFPGIYAWTPGGTRCALHFSPDRPSSLRVPVIPRA